MADETKALAEIAALLRQVTDQRKELEGYKEGQKALREMLQGLLMDRSGKALENSKQDRAEFDERMRKSAELATQRHDEHMQALRDIRAELQRHNETMGQLKELVSLALGRGAGK